MGRAAGRLADLALTTRQGALGIDRQLEAVAAEGPRRDVLVMGIYGADGRPLEEALRRIRESVHTVRVSLGAMEAATPELLGDTVHTDLRGGKFANLNVVAETSDPLAADWILIIDDDIAVEHRFLDRLLAVAERFGFDLAQPALSRASYGWHSVNRRHPVICRETRFVEIGPVVLMRRDVYQQLAPFPAEGMGWGLDLHWSAVAQRVGWRLGVIDAVPVCHEKRRNAAVVDIAAAREAAERLLSERDHVTYAEVESELARHTRMS